MTEVVRKGDAALSLSLAGATYEEIAETLKYRSADVARNDVIKALSRGVDDVTRGEARQKAVMRYERLLRSIWGKACDPANPEQLPAARAAREIIDRIVATQGSAAPQEIVVHNPNNAEILRWIAKVSQNQMPQVSEANPFEVIDAEVVEEGDETDKAAS